ncbi:MAG: pyruvate kinase [Patescibacteria group bacterium]
MKNLKRTKIVCTLGPATFSREKVRALIKAGMNVARLNFSHGTHADHAKLIKIIRQEVKNTGEPIAILQDLQGPKIRVGELPKEGVMLKSGQKIVFTTGKATLLKKLPVTYKKLHQDVKAGEKMLLDDGLLSVEVIKIHGCDVECKVIDGGLLTSHKGLNLPESKVSVSSLSSKDKDDLEFGIKQGVDFVALSFVRSADDVKTLRRLITQHQNKIGKKQAPIKIIAKIEKREAVQNIDEIINLVDGIMVARGDLGIETPAEDVPVIQKNIIIKCLVAAKPVIVATQMLDSMIRNPRPTRAEVSDVANAVIDHADAVMLSGETATGKYPIQAVKMMTKIAQETEASIFNDLDDEVKKRVKTAEQAVSGIARILAENVGAKAILVASLTGDSARLVSSHRPELPIYAVTPVSRTRHQLNLSWDVFPFELPSKSSLEMIVKSAVDHLKKARKIKKGDKIIVVAGRPIGKPGTSNIAEVMEI